jgi:hypothetical protein
MPTRTRKPERIAVKGLGWKKPMSISAERYDQISRAILTVLTREPIRFTELVRRVAQRLPDFAGSVSWYTVSVARELEAQGKLVRHTKPVLYSKPGRAGRKATSTRTTGNKAASRPRSARRSALRGGHR